jgi:hypothetical protein
MFMFKNIEYYFDDAKMDSAYSCNLIIYNDLRFLICAASFGAVIPRTAEQYINIKRLRGCLLVANRWCEMQEFFRGNFKRSRQGSNLRPAD